MSLLGGDCRVPGNQFSENTSHGLDTERKGSNVEEENVLDITSEHSTLNGGANSDSLIGVDGSVWLLAEESRDELTNLGDTGGATDHKNLVDLGLGEAGVLKAVLEGLGGSVDMVLEETLELCSGELQVQVLGASLVEGEERNAD